MPLTPEEQAALEERFVALEERNAKLERLIRSGRAFTNNPLALATDLDDLGSVKTHLDFEEAPLTPVNPPAEVGRVSGVGRTGVSDTSLRYIDSSGVVSELTHTPTVRVTNGAQNMTNNTLVTMTFSTETWDTDDMHSTASNTSRLTAKTAGKYRYNAHVRFASHGTGRRALRVTFNGTTIVSQITVNDTPNDAVDMEITGVYAFTVGDYIELAGFQNAGVDIQTETTTGGSEFAMEWFAP
ncbi:hypothetical protein LCGC14_1681350 [marine sediment metagenome]|uniref:C1q domain-containing protein n=1 Tax=marine sediment metagenome TaxID=412755 RepID=A0A0F9HNK0_9ZZZZ